MRFGPLGLLKRFYIIYYPGDEVWTTGYTGVLSYIILVTRFGPPDILESLWALVMRFEPPGQLIIKRDSAVSSTLSPPGFF